MTTLVYPLEQVLDIKKKRVEDAEAVVREKQEALQLELDKLAEREKERDKVKKHHQDKLDQLREEMDTGTTAAKIQQMKDYLDVVKQKVLVEEKKVEEQKEQVKIAEDNLEAAKNELRMRRNEVDKIKIHKSDWMKQARKELEIEEEREMDEIGSIMHTLHQRMK